MSFEREVVERPHQDKLKSERWLFYKNDRDEVYLDGYYREERLSTRHKLRAIIGYDRTCRGLTGYVLIAFEDVPLPDSVVEQALIAFRKRVVFKGEHR